METKVITEETKVSPTGAPVSDVLYETVAAIGDAYIGNSEGLDVWEWLEKRGIFKPLR